MTAIAANCPVCCQVGEIAVGCGSFVRHEVASITVKIGVSRYFTCCSTSSFLPCDTKSRL